MESMEDFLKELKTAKLKSTGVGPAVSPMTLRRSTNSSFSSSSASSVSTGLQSLRAGLKRKAGPVDAGEQEASRMSSQRCAYHYMLTTHYVLQPLPHDVGLT